MAASKYIIGIDLGTTNSAVAYVDLAQRPGDAGHDIHLFEVPQLIGPGEMEPRPVLPSFLYLPGAYDLPEGSTSLPWDADRRFVVGEMAREQGRLVPGHLISSAKSWLCHKDVDRTAAILPWGSQAKVSKVSPVEASTRYLAHIREAWNIRMAKGQQNAFLERQVVVLTVPASFDEVARELTVTAAKQAGIPNVILLEEPLAACYAWLHDHDETWQDQMQDQEIILVCDVGGGTTDYSIVSIQEQEEGLGFTRLAVGDHLMLGGDNMDMTLGRHVEAKLTGRPGKLDSQRWHRLVHQCRRAKEYLLEAPDERTERAITVLGASGNLIEGTLSGSLTLEEVKQLIMDGFFPEVALEDSPQKTRRTGLTELGLPYAQDPAITRHLAAFWRQFESLLEEETRRATPYPDYVLFNGGTLTPAFIRHRVLDIIQGWFEPVAGDAWQPTELNNPRLDLAVAMGAAYYGLVRRGEGVRIGSGSPRSYFVGVGSQRVEEEQIKGVCVVPRGTEEGFEVALEEPSFEALTNQPVSFHMFYSGTRLGDQLGDVADLGPEEVQMLPPIRTVLKYGKKGVAQKLPVQLSAHLTEIGTLALWCHSQQSNHRWQLQFDVRQAGETGDGATGEGMLDAERLQEAQQEIQAAFQGDGNPERLRKVLEATLSLPRAEWPVPLIRSLADVLLSCPSNRSAQHEARWLNLLGYCLRPGYGDLMDEYRMNRLWKVYRDGLQFSKDQPNRVEWWVFWRRVAGGLGADKQTQVYRDIQRLMRQAARGAQKKKGKGTATSTQEKIEYWRALANFERLNAKIKADLGRQLLRRIRQGKPRKEDLWALSRLGGRIALYGSVDNLVPGSEVTSWLKTMLAANLSKDVYVARTLVYLGQYTGDRTRDVSGKVRNRIEQWLDGLPNSEHFQDMLLHPEHAGQTEEQNWMFGEALPTGLVLAS